MHYLLFVKKKLGVLNERREKIQEDKEIM